MQKYADVVLDRKGNVVTGAFVRVKTSLGADAVLYGDNALSPLGNPITTDSLGRFAFYAANGRYNLQVYIGTALFATSNDILLEDPQDETPEAIKGGIIKDSALLNVTIDGDEPVTSGPLAAINLESWARIMNFTLLSATRDEDDAVTSAVIEWPDKVVGAFTADVVSVDFPGAVDAWHATHGDQVVTQPLMTRNANGAVIAQPSPIIS